MGRYRDWVSDQDRPAPAGKAFRRAEIPGLPHPRVVVESCNGLIEASYVDAAAFSQFGDGRTFDEIAVLYPFSKWNRGWLDRAKTISTQKR